MSEVLVASADGAAAFLTAFANSKRIQIMCEILAAELPVGVIASRVGLSQSALSQHLARLRSLGVVRTRRDKQTIYYSCASEDVRRLFDTLEAIFADHFRPYETAEAEMAEAVGGER